MALAPSDLATWVGSISTSLALIAAGIVVWIELRRDARARLARESADQADLVASWPDRDVVVIRNGSNLPIFRVMLIASRDGEERVLRATPLLPPGDERVVWPEDIFATDDLGDGWRDERPEWTLELLFQDTAGRRWRRDHEGALERRAV